MPTTLWLSSFSKSSAPSLGMESRLHGIPASVCSGAACSLLWDGITVPASLSLVPSMSLYKTNLDFWLQLFAFWFEDTFLPLITWIINCLGLPLDVVEVRVDCRWFSALQARKARTGWVGMVTAAAATPAVASESSKRRDMPFSDCFGKSEKWGGRERLLWFLVFYCEKELGATATNKLDT